jgi:hypothetical protein
VDPDGVAFPSTGGPPVLFLCSLCHSSLKKKKLPPLSLANRTFLGPVPEELKNLTVIEEAMIARCRCRCWTIQLKEENQDLVLFSTQGGVKGHVIIYPQQPSQNANILPPSIEEITSPVCILFVGSSPPSPEWLRVHAKPLAVNAHRVWKALEWLKTHNPLYKDIQFNEECLQHLEVNLISSVQSPLSKSLALASPDVAQLVLSGHFTKLSRKSVHILLATFTVIRIHRSRDIF